MLKILIADDQELVRLVLRYSILDSFEEPLIKEVDNGEDLLNEILQNKWDIVITDITMPKKNGIEVLEEVLNHKITAPILVFSGHSENEYGVKVMNLGAAGFVNKLIPPEELINIIKMILKGEKYMSDSLKILINESQNIFNK